MNKSLFKIKVCGVKTIEDAQMLIDKGVHAIGLNFYKPSPRSIDTQQARRIAAHVSNNLVKVGLFVNAPIKEIDKTLGEVDVDMIQIHGDEPPEFLADLPREIPLIRAFRIGEPGLREAESYLDECVQKGRVPEMALIDAVSKGAYGGTGKQVDWSLLALEKHLLGTTKIALAGGVNPSNVFEAISIVRPDAIDTASGVESAPGVKDARMTSELVEQALSSFQDS